MSYDSDGLLSQGEIDALMAGIDSDFAAEPKIVQLTQQQIDEAVEEFKAMLVYRLKQKGFGTFASTHEIAGVVDEEHREMMDALRANDIINFKAELIDIAVGAVFGVACVNAQTLDW